MFFPLRGQLETKCNDDSLCKQGKTTVFLRKHPPHRNTVTMGSFTRWMGHPFDEWESTPTVTGECDAGILPVMREPG
ncbi:MAG: hypothetical protein HWN65_19910 [Candidatus Helarchaeota archaeon]|nr:hypothetical protein [Candidatus Helarchaeota archaeon]